MADEIDKAQKINECISTISTPEQLRSASGFYYATMYENCLKSNLILSPELPAEENARLCVANFENARQTYCKAKVEREIAIPTPTPTPLPADDDPAYNKKREEAKAQNVQAETSQKKLKEKAKKLAAQKLAFNVATLLPIPGAVGEAIGQAARALSLLTLLKKTRTAIQDQKLKNKKDLAKQKKEEEKERQKATKGNIKKSADAYSYPLTPNPTPTPTVTTTPADDSEASVAPPIAPDTSSTKYFVKVKLYDVKGTLRYAARYFKLSPGKTPQTLTDSDILGTVLFPPATSWKLPRVTNDIINEAKRKGFYGNPKQPDFDINSILVLETVGTLN